MRGEFRAVTPRSPIISITGAVTRNGRREFAALGKQNRLFTVMIKVLRGLFGENPREHPVKKPTPIAIVERSNTGGDFRAVSLAPSIRCCAAAKHATGRRVLLGAA